MALIGCLDDDSDFLRTLSALLERGGHEPVAYRSAGRLLDAVTLRPPALLVIDATFEGMDAVELVRLLRRSGRCARLPIILVAEPPTELDRVVRGFDDGADEYLPKPLDEELFLIRVSSLLRRGPAPRVSELIELGPLGLDIENRQAYVDGKPIELRHLEFDLLVYFARNANRMVTRPLLLSGVWKQPGDVETRTVDKHVENLRRKLGSRVGACIETVIGVGYLFRPPSKPSRRAARR